MNKPNLEFGKFRNKKCPCGSGNKYKKCHLFLDQGWRKTKIGWKYMPTSQIV